MLNFWKPEPQYAYKRYAYKKNMYQNLALIGEGFMLLTGITDLMRGGVHPLLKS